MRNLFCLCCLFSILSSHAQTDFYDGDSIQEIKIYFSDPNWDEILDDLYIAGDEERTLCDIEINGTSLNGVGIRYKGFSSVSVDRDKNPFNIDLDYTIAGQDYEGIDK
ncbi:MAG: spore coat protein CotH, partial [Flavobacteriales bacterium]